MPTGPFGTSGKNIQIEPRQGTLKFFGAGGTAENQPITFQVLDNGSIRIYPSGQSDSIFIQATGATAGNVLINDASFVKGSGLILPIFNDINSVPNPAVGM